MKMRRWIVTGLAIASFGLSGCAVFLLGAGAAGGYALGKDSVQNSYDLSKDYVFRQSLTVANQMGFVTLEDQQHGRINLNIEGTTVSITVMPLTKKTVELKVKARKAVLPKIDVAQQVYNKIAERLQ